MNATVTRQFNALRRTLAALPPTERLAVDVATYEFRQILKRLGTHGKIAATIVVMEMLAEMMEPETTEPPHADMASSANEPQTAPGPAESVL